MREAANRDEIVARVTAATGIRLGFLSGRDEARLTFLAARAWYGWWAGRLLLADIGGGSLEIAHGEGREPEPALSLPLGAGRLTREMLPGDPPSSKHVQRLGRRVYDELEELAAEVRPGLAGEQPVRPVATSKTFTQLARLTGAPRRKAGPYAHRVLDVERLREAIPVLAAKKASARAKLRGVSRPRAPQILAGAIVAEAWMTTMDIDRVDICPWAIREGLHDPAPPGDVRPRLRRRRDRPAHPGRPRLALAGAAPAASRPRARRLTTTTPARDTPSQAVCDHT
ncbi:hypothetical protein LUW76_46385 [Actinomadura madurae]|uniref:Ppx/GppA phosphatase family protein n=1 Tax=Actinomadura madurae TaxID=1993 RepID=UPI002026E26E|nr:hypothetical protein [Actinomadura madurae]URN01146.1 hypothetical protein LUW76_46385 [Actinomadura madurae]